MPDVLPSRPSKRRRVTPPPDTNESNSDDNKAQKQFFKSAANWNLEQTYENRSRKAKKKEAKKTAGEAGRLPVKTAGGTWTVQDDAASVASDAEWMEADGDDEDAAEQHPQEETVPEEPKIPEREQIRRAQEELAKIATQLNEDPEEHPGAFKAMARIAESPILAIKKLCLVTQMTVYKDVIPGYRIRPATDEAEKLSKEVKKLRAYEQALVTGYQGYIKSLAHFASSSIEEPKKRGTPIASIAITCACTLINAVSHFNFRGDLLRVLVRKLSGRKLGSDFTKCRQTLETLFKEDEEGNASMEAVSLLTKMMRSKEYRVDESVLNTFLHLRLLGEYSGKASTDSVDKPTETYNGKKPKQKKEFRTKKQRKLLKQQKEAEKVMAHADAAVSHEERERMQSETLKMVFAAYFRILKERVPHLMGAVLEGLAKYAHLINRDFFGDLLEALKQLIAYTENPDKDDGDTEMKDGKEEDDDDLAVVRDTSREALLCTVTAFALLEGQDAHNARSDLHLDLSFFITHLFRSLLPLAINADLELGAKSLHLVDPNDTSASRHSESKINVQTTTVLLMRCLSGVLLPPWNIRSVPPLRLAAFTKQLMTVALQLPEKSCQAMIGLLNEVLHTHGRKINALWNTEERKGDGIFKPFAETIEGSNPFASTVWEGELLRKHYCPKVREEVKAMEKELRHL